MEDKRIIKLAIIFSITGTVILLPFFSLAYSEKTTHPALTSEIVKFFNIHYPNLELDDKERSLIMQGSVDEDAFGRWMRHYYDPVYNRGLGLIKKWQSSKEWSQDTAAQAGIADSVFAGSLKEYFSGEDDYSWERAIYEYAWRDKGRGLKTLGHILHLIEDATVPDHTRNDPHLVYLDEVFHDRSPYEHWTSKFDIGNIDAVNELKNKKPIKLNTLDEYFDAVANYSNNNFFSKDTILSEEYSSPVIKMISIEVQENEEKSTFGYYNIDGEKYRLVRIKNKFNKGIGKYKKSYLIEDPDHLILSDYWDLLSKQAVLNGAGVVKLFFDEVEKERKMEILKKKNRSWFQKVYDATAADIFNTSKALYGSSVTYEDLQGAVIESQKDDSEKQQIIELISRPVLDIDNEDESVIKTAEVPESEIEEIAEDEDIVADISNDVDKSKEQNEDKEPDFYDSKLIPIDTPFFGGGGGGVKTPLTTEAPTSLLPIPPTIISPSGVLFATTTITFSGVASSTLIISNDFSNATTTANENGEWSLTLSDFQEGTTAIRFIATNSDNLSSDATEFSVAVDTTAPQISSFSILECDYSLRNDGNCLSGSGALNMSWTSTSTDISYYSIIKDGASVATTTATSSSQTFSNGSSHSVAIVAYDEAGNNATSSARSVEIFTTPIVINEIAWSGTASSSADEWIEIYNRTGYTIDLSDIALVADDGVPYLSLSGTIVSNGYYLIERTDDNATSVGADLVVAFSGEGASSGLSNSGEVLSLIHSLGGLASTTLDSTPNASLCFGAWCAGGAGPGYISMERINPDISGAMSSNWANNNTYTKNGTDIGGNAINGTPRSQNSVNLASIGYYCPDKTSSYLSGGYYMPTSGSCVYLSSALSGNRYGDLYRGVVASSTIVMGHSLGSNATSTQSNDALSSPTQGEDYFTAIYKIRTGPAYNDLTDFRNYFKTGANPPPHLNYGVLRWKYGVAP